jgi:hypothetical protein
LEYERGATRSETCAPGFGSQDPFEVDESCISAASLFLRNNVDIMASMTVLKKDLRKKIKKILADVSDAAASAQSEFIMLAQDIVRTPQLSEQLLRVASF